MGSFDQAGAERTWAELLGLLADRDVKGKRIHADIIEAARGARILDVLAGKRDVRRLLGKAAEAFRVSAARGALQLAWFKRIAAAFESVGVPLAPLKGMAYGLMFDRGGPTRAMADIDLLVPPEHFGESCRIIKDLGCQEHFPIPISRAAEYHERTFVKGEHVVEVHRAFLPPRRINVDYDQLWQRTLPLEKEGIHCRRLSPEDTFLYHCLHMGLHEFEMGLRPVWELRRLILEDKPNLDLCATRTREWGTLRMTWCALRLLEYCWPEAIKPLLGSSSPQVSKSSRQGLDDRREESIVMAMFEPEAPVRAILERFVVQPSRDLLVRPGPMPRAVQLFRKTLLVDSPMRGLRYAWWYAKAVSRI